MVSAEFQAVVMAAGKGSRMTEITAKKPKCLLPVGNLPMIWFPIHMLERSGFQEVIVVILEPAKSEVQAALDKLGFKIKIELIGIPSEDSGTADSLRYLQENNKIKSDVLVVSCDAISNVNLTPLFDLYRKHDASFAGLFFQSNSSSSQTLPTPGPKSKTKPERDFVGINGATSRLVFIGSASDYEEFLPMSCKLLKRYGRITLHSRLNDAHIYIISHWLCQYLSTNRNISTLKGELLPHVVKKHLSSSSSKFKIDQDKASIIGMDTKKGTEPLDISNFAQEPELTCKIRSMSAYTDNRCQPVYNNDSIRCYAHVICDDTYAVRANTLPQYCRVNREILEKWSTLTSGKELVHVSPSAVVKSTQFDQDSCLIGEKTQIAEKTSVKNSIIGPNVSISQRTRVINSVIMHGVKIGEGCSIQNCVICEESIIEDGCDLKDCLVGSQHTVQSKGKHSNEVLTEEDRLMEI